MGYAKGSRALGVCDRCGFAFRLNSLHFQQVEGRLTTLKVCPGCTDIDNEQWTLRYVDLSDNQNLREPRPETAEAPDGAALTWGAPFLMWGYPFKLTWGYDGAV